MNEVRTHYETLLASVYTWMSGGQEARQAAARALFEKLAIAPHDTGRALDLGAGSGFQSIPLAARGFAVRAVDSSPSLLAELRENARGMKVEAVEADFEANESVFSERVDVAVCMGDTLSHLSDAAAVEKLVERTAAALAPGGRVVLTYRDLRRAPEGTGRFLPIRSDADRIFTCVLEPVDDARMRVWDLLHVRDGDHFVQHVSSYEKLRLDPAWVERNLQDAGLRVEHSDIERGLVTQVARRPPQAK